MDDKIDKCSREKIHKMLKDFQKTAWTTYFLALFDGVFDPSQTGRPRLIRSLTISCLALIFVFAIWITPIIAKGEIKDIIWLFVSVFILFGFSINLAGDYFSLWETRSVLTLMDKTRSAGLRFLLVVFDLVVSVFIFYVATVLGSILFKLIWSLVGWTTTYDVIAEYVRQAFLGGGLVFFDQDNLMNLFGVFFITTLLTSIWIWAYYIAFVLWPQFVSLERFFNGDKYPVGAAMAICGLVLGLMTTLIGLVVEIASKLNT